MGRSHVVVDIGGRYASALLAAMALAGAWGEWECVANLCGQLRVEPT